MNGWEVNEKFCFSDESGQKYFVISVIGSIKKHYQFQMIFFYINFFLTKVVYLDNRFDLIWSVLMCCLFNFKGVKSLEMAETYTHTHTHTHTHI